MPYTEKQERMLRNKASGNPGVGPSEEVAKSMLRHSDGKAPARKKDRKKKKSYDKLKRTVRQAIKGYKRSGGLWDRIKDQIKEGAKKAKELPEKD